MPEQPVPVPITFTQTSTMMMMQPRQQQSQSESDYGQYFYYEPETPYNINNNIKNIKNYHHYSGKKRSNSNTKSDFAASPLCSPQTITLRNQTAAIAKGMYCDGSGNQGKDPAPVESESDLYLPYHQDQQQTTLLSSLRMGAKQGCNYYDGMNHPLLLTTLTTTRRRGSHNAQSKPIRIERYGRQQRQLYQAEQEEEEKTLSASPSELKNFYDQATWRMYHLIQAARLEQQEWKKKQQANKQNSASANTTTTADQTQAQAQDDDLRQGIEYLRDEAFCRLDGTRFGTAPISITTKDAPQVPLEDELQSSAEPGSPETEEFFELEDL